jgi:hypothetical protein
MDSGIDHLLRELDESEIKAPTFRRHHQAQIQVHEQKQEREVTLGAPTLEERKPVWMIKLHDVDVPLDANYQPILPVLSDDFDFETELTRFTPEMAPALDFEHEREIESPQIRPF